MRRSESLRPNLERLSPFTRLVFTGLILAAVAGLGIRRADGGVPTEGGAEKPKTGSSGASKGTSTPAKRQPLTPEQQKQLVRTVDKGLEFLASRQEADGSFPTDPSARPAVTSLCVMAFLSRGHRPGKAPYGKQIERAIDYVLDVQNPESGALMPPPQNGQRGAWDFAGNYNHGISAVMLAQAYPLTVARRSPREKSSKAGSRAELRRHERIGKAVRKGLTYTRKEQLKSKSQRGARGGWRYVEVHLPNESDLSVTAWMVMFLHEARKSGFPVPDRWTKEALGFVHRTFDAKERAFVYALAADERYCSRGMVGAGIVCLLFGGEQAGETTKEAGDWIRKRPFEPYNNSLHPEDRYHYSAFYCSQAMYLLGGEYFQEFYPKLLRVLSENQHADGSWDVESIPGDAVYGNAYTTALAVLALSRPYEQFR